MHANNALASPATIGPRFERCDLRGREAQVAPFPILCALSGTLLLWAEV